ncbi:RraA family protein [Alicyclobacillus tolerans]|uniref:RraA family protein n=1 Tax=Alicyclobacillus tolerans TaxID=90970 RepID=UPI001F404069|nr:RraA family protein [Alicyclobacillus tolerans]MCF8567323.1 RraA family protein [Alicyclobacillus tolerans]
MSLAKSEMYNLISQKLYTGVICDTLDQLGFRNQAMREDIRPMDQAVTLVGTAKTMLAVDVYQTMKNPYDTEIKAIDSIQPDEVVVVATNRSTRNGPWGELLSTAAKMRGARGAIVDGLIRDSKRISELRFPVFCTGFKPVDSNGRGIVIDYDCPVEVGGVLVNSGDIVFADHDGVVVIPKDTLEQVVEIALQKVNRENRTREELLQGKLLRDVYEKYGVL